MTRRPIDDTPFGSPEAGVVKVYRIDPETGEKVLVAEGDPFDSDLSPGTTLPRGRQAGGTDGVTFETGNEDS